MSVSEAWVKEFHFLEDKQQTQGLSPDEEQRLLSLQKAIAEASGYWAADGNWYPYQPIYYALGPSKSAEGAHPSSYAEYAVDVYGNPLPPDPSLTSAPAGVEPAPQDSAAIGAAEAPPVPTDPAIEFADAPVVSDDISSPSVSAFETTLPDFPAIQLDTEASRGEPNQPESIDSPAILPPAEDPLSPDVAAGSAAEAIELAPAAEFVEAAAAAAGSANVLAERAGIELSPAAEENAPMEIERPEDERVGQLPVEVPPREMLVASAADFMSEAAAANHASQLSHGSTVPPSNANGAVPLARIATRSVPSSEASSPIARRAAAPPPPPPAPQSSLTGEHRVIVHTLEGQVKRGVVRDVDFREEAISLEQPGGAPAEQIPCARLKAVFFMAVPGDSTEVPSKGKKIRVTFNDGRLIAGYCENYNSGNGFFVTPSDTRTNTKRIYVFRNSVQSIAPG